MLLFYFVCLPFHIIAASLTEVLALKHRSQYPFRVYWLLCFLVFKDKIQNLKFTSYFQADKLHYFFPNRALRALFINSPYFIPFDITIALCPITTGTNSHSAEYSQ